MPQALLFETVNFLSCKFHFRSEKLALVSTPWLFPLGLSLWSGALGRHQEPSWPWELTQRWGAGDGQEGAAQAVSRKQGAAGVGISVFSLSGWAGCNRPAPSLRRLGPGPGGQPHR